MELKKKKDLFFEQGCNFNQVMVRLNLLKGIVVIFPDRNVKISIESALKSSILCSS